MRRNIGSLLGRKGASLALAAAVAAAGLGAVVAPTRAMAKSDAAIAYIDETGASHELAAGSYTDISDSSFEDKEGYGLVDGWYVVRGNRSFDNRMTITGDAKLVLCNGTTVNFEDGIRGYSGKLTIYAQSYGDRMGKLIATADGGEAAGIGGNNDEDNKTEIVICGGNIVATGDDFGAGIGGGDHGGCGTIRICGGNVTAKGGDNDLFSMDYGGAAGIGSGDAAKSGGSIEISGGVVNATAGSYGAGIGTGDEAKETVDVTISGGKVHGEAIGSGAGIGGGNEVRGKVTITGGEVEARARSGGAGIGGGCEASADISITGGEITTYCYYDGAGIGGGGYASGGTINISGGNIKVHGLTEPGVCASGASIGGGARGNSGRIIITGGTIEIDDINDANSNGIGCGSWGENESIQIPGGHRVISTKTNERVPRYDRYDMLSHKNIRIEPCDHDQASCESVGETHRFDCPHCFGAPGNQPHEAGLSGYCGVCGYNDGKPHIVVELGEEDKMTATLRFWVNPNGLTEEELEVADIELHVDGAYEVDGSKERLKHIDLADVEKGEGNMFCVECHVVIDAEKDSPVVATLHYGKDKTAVCKTTLEDLRTLVPEAQ